MWGLRPEHSPTPWWGARAIFRAPGSIDLLHDRMSREGGGTEVQALCKWLDKSGLPLLKEHLDSEYLDPGSEKEVRIEQDGYVLIANPRMSCGYLYLGAWRVEDW